MKDTTILLIITEKKTDAYLSKFLSANSGIFKALHLIILTKKPAALRVSNRGNIFSHYIYWRENPETAASNMTLSKRILDYLELNTIHQPDQELIFFIDGLEIAFIAPEIQHRAGKLISFFEQIDQTDVMHKRISPKLHEKQKDPATTPNSIQTLISASALILCSTQKIKQAFEKEFAISSAKFKLWEYGLDLSLIRKAGKIENQHHLKAMTIFVKGMNQADLKRLFFACEKTYERFFIFGHDITAKFPNELHLRKKFVFLDDQSEEQILKLALSSELVAIDLTNYPNQGLIYKLHLLGLSILNTQHFMHTKTSMKHLKSNDLLAFDQAHLSELFSLTPGKQDFHFRNFSHQKRAKLLQTYIKQVQLHPTTNYA
ncbi:hypothetical protein [Pedobacter sp. Leaf216]|uniref:hypothetical protein n=1 Tax=Pedobacter sp. Leaf216 TaxID=1735684 RepID=UPI000A7056E9|nr:hypothetical protein [Pedobacter sp. Leaf216]